MCSSGVPFWPAHTNRAAFRSVQELIERSEGQDLIHDFESLRKQIVNIRGGQRSSFACAISAGGVQSHFRPLSLLFFLFERVYPSCFRTVVMR